MQRGYMAWLLMLVVAVGMMCPASGMAAVLQPFQVADAGEPPHFLALAPVRAGKTQAWGIHRPQPATADAAPAGALSNVVSVAHEAAAATGVTSAAPVLRGFMPLRREALIPLHVRAPMANPSKTAIASSLAASNTAHAANSPPGANPHATSPTLQLFGLENAPSDNFYQALRGR